MLSCAAFKNDIVLEVQHTVYLLQFIYLLAHLLHKDTYKT